MRSLGAVLLVLLAGSGLASHVAPPAYPANTAQFFDSGVFDAVAAPGGGVWAAAPGGIARYMAAGAGTVYPTPGGRPARLAAAADGSIWFVTAGFVGRMSASGVVLEQHALTGVNRLAVGTDGAVWYARSHGEILGRIAAGGFTELPAPEDAFSIAAAPDGDLWLLGAGFGTDYDDLHRITPGGGVTTIPLGHDVLVGTLQSLPDGTLLVGTGIRRSVLRLDAGGQTFTRIDLPENTYAYLADPGANLWTGGYAKFGFIARAGTPRIEAAMPADPRQCTNIPAWFYEPLTIDSEGGLWMQIYDGATYIPGVPCDEPEPPPMPDLIRVDASRFLESHMGRNVPALSPAMLIALAVAIAAAAVWHMRG